MLASLKQPSVQVCKYPEKTKRRKMNLSSYEMARSQAAALHGQAGNEDDEDEGGPRHRAAAIRKAPHVNKPGSTGASHDGWKSNSKDGNGNGHDWDADNGPVVPRTGSRGSKTDSSGASSRATARKRPSGTEQGDGHATKKPKFAPPPVQLGMCKWAMTSGLGRALTVLW